MRRRKTTYALAGQALIILAMALLAWLHILEPEVSPLRQFVSDYARSGSGAYMSAFFAILGLGSLLITYSLQDAGSRSSGVFCLYLWSVTTLVAGIFTTDGPTATRIRTAEGMAHDIAAIVAFIAILAGMLTTRIKIGKIAFVCAVLAFAVLSFFEAPGFGERVFLAVALAWLLSLPQLAGQT
jgi:Protein of unknown function (DUF998)